MATVEVNGTAIAYEIIGSGPDWVLTPGGRFSKDTPGVRELAEELAAHGQRVLIWDRPNTGASDICFTGASESEMQADTLAGLLVTLDLAPAIVIGGSGGSRVSLLAASRHPEVASRLAVWWITGGIFGLLTLATVYCGESIRATWQGGMEAVVALPGVGRGARAQPGQPSTIPRPRPASSSRRSSAGCRCTARTRPPPFPAFRTTCARSSPMPTLIFRSGASDPYHTRATSEALHALVTGSRLVEPPWGDNEWNERRDAATSGAGHLFERWPMLAAQLLEFASD